MIMIRSVKQVSILVVTCVATFLFVLIFARPNIIHGISMENTIDNGDVIIVEKVSVFLKKIHYSDIVLIDTQLRVDGIENIKLTKRIIGLPGDQIEIKNGLVYRQGKMIFENYLSNTGTFGMISVVVPESHVFVLGDNRSESLDSRDSSIGFVPIENIIGKAYFRLYPLKKFGEITHEE